LGWVAEAVEVLDGLYEGCSGFVGVCFGEDIVMGGALGEERDLCKEQ
jgi:hypothetical protein